MHRGAQPWWGPRLTRETLTPGLGPQAHATRTPPPAAARLAAQPRTGTGGRSRAGGLHFPGVTSSSPPRPAASRRPAGGAPRGRDRRAKRHRTAPAPIPSTRPGDSPPPPPSPRDARQQGAPHRRDTRGRAPRQAVTPPLLRYPLQAAAGTPAGPVTQPPRGMAESRACLPGPPIARWSTRTPHGAPLTRRPRISTRTRTRAV